MSFKTVAYELNKKYCLEILAKKKSDKTSENFSGYFYGRTKPRAQSYQQKFSDVLT
jgi:hypothetical protein